MKEFFVLLLILLLFPSVEAGLTNHHYASGAVYGTCIIYNEDYVLDDRYNQSAITFSIENGNIGNLVLCSGYLSNLTELPDIQSYINFLYNVSILDENFPDVREKLAKRIFEDKEKEKLEPQFSFLNKKPSKYEFESDLLNKSNISSEFTFDLLNETI